MFTKYNGFIAQVTKRMSHNWQLVSSLVLAKSEGRLPSALNSPTGQQEGVDRAFYEKVAAGIGR